jgi:hypothetical protein
MKALRQPPKTPFTPEPAPKNSITSTPSADLVFRHLRTGWWSLLLFLTVGLFLEALHAFKVGAYLNVTNETRRLMWTLAHAHGTLLGLVNLGFASTLHLLPAWPESPKRFASVSLLAATGLMPVGFFLGGLFIYSGDPGLGIVLVPLGGALLFVAVLLTALALRRLRDNAR